MKKNRRALSKTPRKPEHSRKIHFSIAMRKKISENWIALRKELQKKRKSKKKR